jgi:hypothetical protein
MPTLRSKPSRCKADNKVQEVGRQNLDLQNKVTVTKEMSTRRPSTDETLDRAHPSSSRKLSHESAQKKSAKNFLALSFSSLSRRRVIAWSNRGGKQVTVHCPWMICAQSEFTESQPVFGGMNHLLPLPIVCTYEMRSSRSES